MKTFRVEISTFMLIDAVEGLDAIAEARYHFMQLCRGTNDAVLARDASYDVTVVMCPKCFSADCQGNCESQRRVPVIQRDRE